MSGPQDVMSDRQKVNILLVDDQPAKLLSYEVILRELGENLLKAPSAQSAFEHLLKSDIAVILADVCMPDLDGFELARMIREHPRFQKTAIIFVSAVLLTDLDFLQGYRYGAVDYLSVPVIPEILRAKVKVFVELYRKTQQLEHMNHELEQRVAERTAALEASAAALRKSEERLRLAFDAAQMGWWDYDIVADQVTWSPSLVRIMGFAPESFGATLEGALTHVHPEDREQFITLVRDGMAEDRSRSCELRFTRPDGSVRWSLAAGQVIRDAAREPIRFAGVDLDITQRKEAEERQTMLVRELDHRARNLLAVVQSVLHLSRASTTPEFIAAVDGRIRALSRTHTMLSETRWRGVELGRIVEEEIAPFATGQSKQIAAEGPAVSLPPPTAQSLALALHELVTNAVKHGALSVPEGRLSLGWEVEPNALIVRWTETGGPATQEPTRRGFGTKVIAAGIEQQLGGRAAFEWRGEGLLCTLTIPRKRIDKTDRFVAVADGLERPETTVPPSLSIAGNRILAVEDEPLVAAMLGKALTDLGFAVIGPIGTVAPALQSARTDSIDGAILDLNVGGEPVYPVADALMARGIPFVFLTGYRSDGIDRRYAHVPALQKPIDPEALRHIFTSKKVDPNGLASGPPVPQAVPGLRRGGAQA
jgi:PAS domain S-box-containing protein